MKKIRDAMQFRCVEDIAFLAENGMTVETSFDIKPYDSRSKRWEYKYCVGSSIVVDDDTKDIVVEEIKKRVEDGIIHYLYKDILGDLYKSLRDISNNNRNSALLRISDLINKINKGE